MIRHLCFLPTRLALASCACICLVTAGGCAEHEKPPPKPVAAYPNLGPKKVPDFLEGSIYQYVELRNTEPVIISGYGLVVDLNGTGNADDVPTGVKQYMTKQMAERGFGSSLMPGFEKMSPDQVLKDKRVAIVELVGLLSPGVRKQQQFDVYVSALRQNSTTSLAGGRVYLSDLAIGGADPQNPFNKTRVYAYCRGPIFVNPAYALDTSPMPTGSARASLRSGVVMDGAISMVDLPVIMQVRTPQSSLARAMERRIRERFGEGTAAAHDEGAVALFVPKEFRGDWQHFAGVATHLFINDTHDNPALAAVRAQQLAKAALKPDAPLSDISLCWEGIGIRAMPVIAPLLTGHSQEVTFAAARAGAFLGDPTNASQATLLDIARTDGHPFQINAVQVLGALPPSNIVNKMLRELLNSNKTLVRIEAYKILARNNDETVYSRVIGQPPDNEKFILDIVPSQGPPILYATRSGTPRFAVIGQTPHLATPITFAVLDNRLSISAPAMGQHVTLFYRDPLRPRPVKVLSQPDIAEVIARLGGLGAQEDDHLDFNYGQVVAIVEALADRKLIVTAQDGQLAAAPLILQESPRYRQAILSAPEIDAGRPQLPDRAPATQPATPPDAGLLGRAQ